MFKVKNYPFNEYTDASGKSVGFVYKYDEDDMLNNDKYSNGFFHYAYFEDRCIECIRWGNIINPIFYRKERLGSTTVSSIDLFFHNLLHRSRAKKIHVIKPMKRHFDKQSFISFRNIFSDRYQTIVLGEDMYIDMVSLNCTGTRAYATLLAKVNNVRENVKLTTGKVLIVPNNILCECDGNSLYKLSINHVGSIYNCNDKKEFNKRTGTGFTPMDRDVFFIRETYTGFIYIHGEYVKLHV